MRINQETLVLGGEFAEYIDWRIENPSDDIVTDLLNAEFEDYDGTRRRLTRQELLTYVYVIAGAGNETSARLIGWTAKVLADHPDQRREIVEDRFPGSQRRGGDPSV
jgi:cytochrome P450